MLTHSSHWGAFRGNLVDGSLNLYPHPDDPDPSPILANIASAARHRMRLKYPMVRRRWLEGGPGPDKTRGHDSFVRVSWDEALTLVSRELARVTDQFGLTSIFGGSQGWGSAGRFHHAQSQLHRFLNVALGGYVRSINNYSAGASEVIFPYIFGYPMMELMRRNVTWEQIASSTEILLAFGGLPLKNSQVAPGGVSRHIERPAISAAAERGCRIIVVSPLRTDLPEGIRAEWVPIEPGTDTALILGLVHTLVTADRHDQQYLDRYCDGWDVFRKYLLGDSDGVPKTARWASDICRVPEETIVNLAHTLVGRRVLVTLAHSLQRSEHGEQPVWAGAVLAAVLGQIGQVGGGYSYALGTMALHGRRMNAVPVGALPQGDNSVEEFIPVARIADMLHGPGEAYPYNGRQLRYPTIRLVYWTGGNPMHHHQNLNRLADGFRKLDTFIVQDIAWTATARLADIVLPSTMTIERNDIGATVNDNRMIAMHQLLLPIGEARDEFDIFSDLAERLGRRREFTENRSTRDWLAWLFEITRTELERTGMTPPTFDEFWTRGELILPQCPDDGGRLRAFYQDPIQNPLPTPSGKIQITSKVIASFGLKDCPGHPAWLVPTLAPDAIHPLWLISNQPERKLHSQLDFADYSQAGKIEGREVCVIHPDTAAQSGIREGDVVRIFNDIGACLAVAQLSEHMLPNVVRLPTGAWFNPSTDPLGEPICIHGNPNVMTRDRGTSTLAQGCSGHLVPVAVEKYSLPVPRVNIFDSVTVANADLSSSQAGMGPAVAATSESVRNDMANG